MSKENLDNDLNEEEYYEEVEQEEYDDDEAEKAQIKKYGSIILGVVVVIVAAFIGYDYMQQSQKDDEIKAITQLQRVMPLIAQGNYQMALDGAPQGPIEGQPLVGLKQIAREYSSIEAGKTASFYVGKALIELKDYSGAKPYLEDGITSESEIVKAGSFAGLAAINETEENWQAAADNYVKASDNIIYTVKKSKYLYFAGKAFEKAGNNGRSIEIYQQILEMNVKNNGDEFSSLARAGLQRLGTKIDL